MAKKRTLIPFYGKKHQAMEQRAAAMLKAGDSEGAIAISNMISNDLKSRRKS